MKRIVVKILKVQKHMKSIVRKLNVIIHLVIMKQHQMIVIIKLNLN